MNIPERIRERRQQLGLSDVYVARLAGLSIYEYGDVEQHADEFETAISMGDAKKVCRALGLDLRQFLNLPDRLPTDGTSVSDLVCRQRKALGLSVEELADRIGFYQVVIEEIEANADGIDALPLVVIHDLEDVLGFEPGTLIRP